MDVLSTNNNPIKHSGSPSADRIIRNPCICMALLLFGCFGVFPQDRSLEGSIRDDDGSFRMSFAGGVEYSYRYDRYSVDVGEGWLIRAELTSSEIGPSLFLEDPSGGFLIRSFDTWVTDGTASFSHVTSRAGEYHILVTTRDHTERGSYVLSYSTEPPGSSGPASPPPPPPSEPSSDAGPGGSDPPPSWEPENSCATDDGGNSLSRAARPDGPLYYNDRCDGPDDYCADWLECVPGSLYPQCKIASGERCINDSYCASGVCGPPTQQFDACSCQ